MVPISTNAAHFLPMYCARTPRGKRKSAPDIIGTEIIKPFCAGVKPNCSLMNGDMAPFKTHIAKQKSKYRSAIKSVGQWPDFQNPLSSIERLHSLYCEFYRILIYPQLNNDNTRPETKEKPPLR